MGNQLKKKKCEHIVDEKEPIEFRLARIEKLLIEILSKPINITWKEGTLIVKRDKVDWIKELNNPPIF